MTDTIFLFSMEFVAEIPHATLQEYVKKFIAINSIQGAVLEELDQWFSKLSLVENTRRAVFFRPRENFEHINVRRDGVDRRW